MLRRNKRRPADPPSPQPPPQRPPESDPPEGGAVRPPDAFHYGDLQMEIGSALYRGVVEERGRAFATFSARLTFDALERVVGLDDVTGDAQPVVPGPGVVERVNEVSMQFAEAPAEYRLEGLLVEVDEGRITVRPTYVVPPG